MGQSGLVLFALIAVPLFCAAVVILYVRAARAEACERYAALQRSLSPLALPLAATLPAPAFAPTAPPLEPSIEATGTRRLGPPSLSERVALVLGGDHVAAGFGAPMTTAAQRASVAAFVSRSSRRNGHALARVAGLRVELVELPAGAPCCVLDDVLLVRDCDDTEALVYSQAAGRMLADAGILATEADAWLLAAEMAPSSMWEPAAPSSLRSRA